MTWLDRTRRARSKERVAPSPEPAEDEPVARRSPGLAALFDGLHDDGRHTILDLGTADGRQLRLLGRYGRQVRFAGLLPRGRRDGNWLEAVRSVPANPGRPYDVVLTWDLLDSLSPEERQPAVQRLAAITADGARLHAVIDASGAPTRRPLAFRITDLDTVAQTPVGPAQPAGEPILPAQVERALAPFRIVHAFTLRGGLREYVAIRER